jgi:hypothetical protein
MDLPAEKQPADYHPDLTAGRLQDLAGLVYGAARSAYRRHDPHGGDDGWSLGCVRFTRCRNRLIEKDKAGGWKWFGIINDSKRFIFRVGNVPVRFCRGRVSNPPDRTLAVSSDEVYQRSLAFPEDATLAKITWRLLIETGPLGDPSKLVFAGYTSKRSVYCSWDIEIPADALFADAPVSAVPPGVEIDEPIVGEQDVAAEQTDQK